MVQFKKNEYFVFINQLRNQFLWIIEYLQVNIIHIMEF